MPLLEQPFKFFANVVLLTNFPNVVFTGVKKCCPALLCGIVYRYLTGCLKPVSSCQLQFAKTKRDFSAGVNKGFANSFANG